MLCSEACGEYLCGFALRVSEDGYSLHIVDEHSEQEPVVTLLRRRAVTVVMLL